MGPTPIRVAIIEESPKFRRMLIKILGKEPDVIVVAEAENGTSMMDSLEQQRPDVILMDIKEPFTESLETTSRIIGKFPNTRVILLSRHSKSSTAASFCEEWACYFLCDDCSPKKILAAIRETSSIQEKHASPEL
jgi:two-component system response regulator DegU